MTSVRCQGLLKHKVYFGGGSLGKAWCECLHLRVHHLETFQPGFITCFLKAILDDLLELITVMLCSKKRIYIKKKEKEGISLSLS